MANLFASKAKTNSNEMCNNDFNSLLNAAAAQLTTNLNSTSSSLATTSTTSSSISATSINLNEVTSPNNLKIISENVNSDSEEPNVKLTSNNQPDLNGSNNNNNISNNSSNSLNIINNNTNSNNLNKTNNLQTNLDLVNTQEINSRILNAFNLILSNSVINNNSSSLDETLNNNNQQSINLTVVESLKNFLNLNCSNQNLSSLLPDLGSSSSNLNNNLNNNNFNKANSNFSCKYCSFYTDKRQSLIKHAKTHCTDLVNFLGNTLNNQQSPKQPVSCSSPNSLTYSTSVLSNSNNQSSINQEPAKTILATSSSSSVQQVTSYTTSTTTSSTTSIPLSSSTATTSSTNITSNQTAATAAVIALTSIVNNNEGCGNLACVNSNCTNNNSCVFLTGSNGSGTNEDCIEETDFSNSANPQDRFCKECDIQFTSYTNYKVHKQIYCGSRHCGYRVQLTNNLNPRKRTLSETVNQSNSTNATINSTSQIFYSNSANGSHSPTRQTKSPNSSLQQQLITSPGLTSTNSNSVTSSNSNNCNSNLNSNSNLQTQSNVMNSNLLINELLANGKIINPSNLNLLQQLNKLFYIVVSTNPVILLPIYSNLNKKNCNSGLNNLGTNSSLNNQLITLPDGTFNNQLNNLIGQAMLDMHANLNKISSPNQLSNFLTLSELIQQQQQQNQQQQNLQKQNQQQQSTSVASNQQTTNLASENWINNRTLNSSLNNRSFNDQPIDLSAKRKCTNRISSLDNQTQANPRSSPQNNLFNSLTNDSLNVAKLAAAVVNNNSDAAATAAALYIPNLLNLNFNTLTQQQQLQQLYKNPQTYTCSNCAIDFIKQENYIVHKQYYCSATKIANATALAIANDKSSPGPDDSNDILSTSGGTNSPQKRCLDTFKKSSNSITNKNSSRCASPSNSPPISSPSLSLITSNTTTSSTIPTNLPFYKHYCNSCGIRFTSKDNLHAHQTYYCANLSNPNNGIVNNITNFNKATGLIEFKCPKCRINYSNEELFLKHFCPNSVSANSSNQTNVTNTTGNSIAVSPNVTLSSTNTNLLDPIENIAQQSKLSISSNKLTNNLINISNSLINASAANNSTCSTTGVIANNKNSVTNSSSTKSNNNNQAFKCTICGYKGHTLRGMKTHVRLHADQLQGAQEETFIVHLDDCCGSGTSVMNGTCGNPTCRNTRAATMNSNKRRKSADPVNNFLANLTLPNSHHMLNTFNPLLNSQINSQINSHFVNNLMGNFMGNLTSQFNSQLSNSLINDATVMGSLNSTSTANTTQNPSTCNGTVEAL